MSQNFFVWFGFVTGVISTISAVLQFLHSGWRKSLRVSLWVLVAVLGFAFAFLAASKDEVNHSDFVKVATEACQELVGSKWQMIGNDAITIELNRKGIACIGNGQSTSRSAYNLKGNGPTTLTLSLWNGSWVRFTVARRSTDEIHLNTTNPQYSFLNGDLRRIEADEPPHLTSAQTQELFCSKLLGKVWKKVDDGRIGIELTTHGYALVNDGKSVIRAGYECAPIDATTGELTFGGIGWNATHIMVELRSDDTINVFNRGPLYRFLNGDLRKAGVSAATGSGRTRITVPSGIQQW